MELYNSIVTQTLEISIEPQKKKFGMNLAGLQVHPCLKAESVCLLHS